MPAFQVSVQAIRLVAGCGSEKSLKYFREGGENARVVISCLMGELND